MARTRTAPTKKAAILKQTLPEQSSKEGNSVEVRVMLTVKNKMKERLFERIQDGWEYFVNGIGKGITLQLVSEGIDPGEC